LTRDWFNDRLKVSQEKGLAMDPNNYEPIISYGMLHMMMQAFILTCFILPIVGYLGPPLMRWFQSLFHLNHERLPELPEWNFGPELSHVKILDMDVASSNRQPYDWAKEENGYYN
jgi:hypothetical protein